MCVRNVLDLGGWEWLGETRPATSRFILVRRSEQRLAGHDCHVYTRVFVVEIFAIPGQLGAILLRHTILLGRKPRDSGRVSLVCGHFLPPYSKDSGAARLSAI